MWEPRYKNNDIYIGKMAKIYCNDEEDPREGKLIYIKEAEKMKGIYSVCIEKTSGYPTRTTVSDSLIKRVEVKLFEIIDETKNICEKYLNNDISNGINEYLDNYIEVQNYKKYINIFFY